MLVGALACGAPLRSTPDGAATLDAIGTFVRRTLEARVTPGAPFTLTPPIVATPAPASTFTPQPDRSTPTPWANPPSGHIVYVCFLEGFDNLCLMNGDGSGGVRLTTTTATDFYPSLSPDGEVLVFSTRRDGNFEIYAMEVDGRNPRRLTENQGSNFAPEISPDGAQIVFVSAQGGSQDVWVMEVEGSNPRQLTTGGQNVDPTWSPDGQQIAFASKRGGTNELYVMAVADPLQGTDGSSVRQVTPGLDIGGRSDWSPDGRTLTFYAGPAGARNIFAIDVEGNDLRQLTNEGDNRGPAFSPDGQWIVFTGFRDGDNEIYVMRTDGSQLTPLTQNTTPDWQPRWGP